MKKRRYYCEFTQDFDWSTADTFVVYATSLFRAAQSAANRYTRGRKKMRFLMRVRLDGPWVEYAGIIRQSGVVDLMLVTSESMARGSE